MKVIAIKNTKTLIKGKEYEVKKIDQYRGGYSLVWYINIVGLSNTFTLDSFRTLLGNEIEENRYISNKDWYTELTNIREAQKGDIVVCVSKTLKTLTYGKYYTISNTKVNLDGKTVEIAVEESLMGNQFYYSAWINNFKALPKDQKRDININLVLDEEKIDEMVNYNDPIFGNREKECMVLQLMYKSLKYLHDTKLDISLQEIIEHRVKYEQYITMEDVNKFDLKKIMKY